jgi:hypothetical protein
MTGEHSPTVRRRRLAADPWRKSSYSGGNEGGSNCVEVASSQGRLTVRDSKDPGGGELAVSPAQWRAFIASIKDE